MLTQEIDTAELIPGDYIVCTDLAAFDRLLRPILVLTLTATPTRCQHPAEFEAFKMDMILLLQNGTIEQFKYHIRRWSENDPRMVTILKRNQK